MIGGKTLLFYILLGVNFKLIALESNDEDPKNYVDLTKDLENWMSKLPKRLRDVPITDLAIPGTHDSFTSGISSKSDVSPDNKDIPKILGLLPTSLVIANWAKCQALDAVGQLKAGIRFFDARFCRNVKTGEIYFCHGMYSFEAISTLKEIANFLSSHPKEVIIIDCQHFYEFFDEHHNKLIKQIVDIFGAKLVPYTFRMDKLTLNYLASKNQQVIVIYRYYLGRKQLWPTEKCYSKWLNTMYPKSLFSGLNSLIRNRTPNQFFVSQCILTPTVQDILRGAFSSLKQKGAVNFEKERIRWISQQTPGRYGLNLIINDFIDLSDNLFSKTVINLNRKLIGTVYENGVNNNFTWYQRKETLSTFSWVQ